MPASAAYCISFTRISNGTPCVSSMLWSKHDHRYQLLYSFWCVWTFTYFVSFIHNRDHSQHGCLDLLSCCRVQNRNSYRKNGMQKTILNSSIVHGKSSLYELTCRRYRHFCRRTAAETSRGICVIVCLWTNHMLRVLTFVKITLNVFHNSNQYVSVA